MCYSSFARATLRAVKLTRPSGLTLLAGTLLLLMPAIALLQFRWVGELSSAEQERMQRNVEIAAGLFRQELDGEILNAIQRLGVGARNARDAAWDRYATNYDDWQNGAPHPTLVKNVYLIDAEGGEVGVRRWDSESRVFQRTPWPQVLEPWRVDFQKELTEFNSNQIALDRNERFKGTGDQSSLLLSFLRNNPYTLPAQGRADRVTGTRPLTSYRVFGFTVIELDMPFLQHQVLPELAHKHFTHPNGDSYRVSVVDSEHPDQVIYRTDSDAPTDPAKADVTVGIFSRFGTIRAPRPQPQPEPRGAASQARNSADPRDTRAGNTPGSRNPFDDLPVRWRLLVQHQSGSLEAAVFGARAQNLALSFGVLIVLTVTIGLLTVTSRRSQRLARQQMEFVAGVSHELRTPVAVIKSAAENLSQGVVGNADRVKRYGQMIEGEARRLGEMVERVLQYAGIESGLGYGARSPLSALEIVDSAIDSALPLLGPETVTVERDIPDSLPSVVGDAAALRSAVQNLVANAVKYGGSDRWVGVKAEHVQNGRSAQVHITVSDHGPGIPAKELPHIFDPFYRGNEAMAQQIHGNGLGLSLVKRIVNAHGGQVSVVTRAGVGSAFTITLPAADPGESSTVARGVQAAVHP